MTRADQIVVGIVQSVLGHIDQVTSQHVAQAAHLLARPANGREALGLLLFSRNFLNAYYNWNYDQRSNGEQWLINRLAPFRPSVFFDVGANVGNWLLLALSVLPEVEFHAFEIVESTYAILRERTVRNSRLITNNFGLSDRTGTITMHHFNASNEHTSHFAYPHHGTYDHIVCPVRSGDEYMQETGIERIDFLKIDVEGAEHMVLNGFRAALDAGKIDVIQFEYGKVNIITHFLLRDFYEFLEARGYSVGKLFPDHVDFRAYALEDEDFLGPNYVAVRKTRSEIIDVLRRR